MCTHAKRNKLRIPIVDKELSKIPFMGRNCNPVYRSMMQTWFGSAKAQTEWAQRFHINFFGNEIYLPPISKIPFGQFVLGTQLRHPSKRLYSLFQENLNYQYCRGSQSKSKNMKPNNGTGLSKLCSLSSLWINVSLDGPLVSDRYRRSIPSWGYTNPGATTPVHRRTNVGRKNKPNIVGRNNKRNRPNIKPSINSNVTVFNRCKKFDASKLSDWLKTQIRSQDVAYFAGMTHLTGVNNSHGDESSMRSSSGSIVTLTSILFHSIQGVNYNDADLQYAMDMLTRFTFVSILEGMVMK
jgi:hypothetical protein